MVQIGAYDEEYGHAQEILVGIKLTWAADKIHSSASVDDVVDYDGLIVQPILETWPNRPHTPLIETLAEDAVGLCFKDPRVQSVEVSITKTQAYAHAANPTVCLYRHRGQVVG